jgi:uncharacterized membrane protein
MSEENKIKIKIEQYIRCCEDIRHYDTGLWQVSSINITVAGIMIGLTFQYLSGIYRMFPLLLAFFLSFALTVVVSKYIFFQVGRARFMHLIEEEFSVESVPTSTDDTSNFLKKIGAKVDAPAKWFGENKANRWLVSMMLGVTILLLILALVSPFIAPLNRPIDP